MREAPISRRRWVTLLPLALFSALALVFLIRLFAGDPSKLPSALLGKPVPIFSLPALEGLVRDGQPVPGFSTATLARENLWNGKLALVNVFASWCAPCQQEHPLLMDLARDTRLVMFGINQKDNPENARRFLGRLGNPYAAVGTDANGRVSIDWGVYGVPETFLVKADGTIAYKHVGPLSAENIAAKLMPEIAKALGAQ